MNVGVEIRRGEGHAQCQYDEEPNDWTAAMRSEIGRGDCTNYPDVERATVSVLVLWEALEDAHQSTTMW